MQSTALGNAKQEVFWAQVEGRLLPMLEGERELPWRYRALPRVTLRVARWDLCSVDLVDPRTGHHIAQILPLDKEQNADGRRRAVPMATLPADPPPVGIAPQLRHLMADYAATGLPPADLPKDEPASAIAELGDDDLHLDTDVDSTDDQEAG